MLLLLLAVLAGLMWRKRSKQKKQIKDGSPIASVPATPDRPSAAVAAAPAAAEQFWGDVNAADDQPWGGVAAEQSRGWAPAIPAAPPAAAAAALLPSASVGRDAWSVYENALSSVPEGPERASPSYIAATHPNLRTGEASVTASGGSEACPMSTLDLHAARYLLVGSG
jgi:hypothetical protein